MSKVLVAETVAPGFYLARHTRSVPVAVAGRPVVLAFYPADWSPVCGDQMALYKEALPEFHKQSRGRRYFGRVGKTAERRGLRWAR
jgi:peroxiredoxin